MRRASLSLRKTKGNRSSMAENTENLIGEITKVTGEYSRRLNDLIKFVGQFIQALSDVSVGFRSTDDKYRKTVLQSVGSTF
jgi:hypothetical protein